MERSASGGAAFGVPHPHPAATPLNLGPAFRKEPTMQGRTQKEGSARETKRREEEGAQRIFQRRNEKVTNKQTKANNNNKKGEGDTKCRGLGHELP